MAIERACVRAVRKPWGSADLRPWSAIDPDGDPIGELWFQRADVNAPDPALLLKLLFTTKPLSIQVHPDDDYARSIGLPRGKTEAWYILSAVPGARVAAGLKRQVTAPQLRAAIEDGSIANLVRWHGVLKDHLIFVPAGTIHAVGAGLVVAEIQQRSDVTFRLFDYGRQRALQPDEAVAAAKTDPADFQSVHRRLTDERTLLVANRNFVFERIDLPANSHWELSAEKETWAVVLDGHAEVGPIELGVGEALFIEADSVGMTVGSEGLCGLLAYPGPEPSPGLLHDLDGTVAGPPGGFAEVRP